MRESKLTKKQYFLAGVVCSLIVPARSVAAHTSN